MLSAPPLPLYPPYPPPTPTHPLGGALLCDCPLHICPTIAAFEEVGKSLSRAARRPHRAPPERRLSATGLLILLEFYHYALICCRPIPGAASSPVVCLLACLLLLWVLGLLSDLCRAGPGVLEHCERGWVVEGV